MPLRWKLPTEEEADELYRRIDQLMRDLYHLIRSVIFGPPHPLPQQELPETEDEEISVPDLLAQLGGLDAGENDSKEEDEPRPPMR